MMKRKLAALGRLQLESMGCRVHSETNPMKAHEVFGAGPEHSDLVMRVMTLPGMTGDQLTAELLRVGPDISVILCTGFSEKMNEQSAYRISACACALRPLGKKELVATVRRVLDKKT